MNLEEIYETITQWKMTETESIVLKICYQYVELYNKNFPNERKISISNKKDPRKSSLFSYAWKFHRETKNLLKENEYNLFIQAQFQLLKKLGDNKEHARVDPNCLCGEKAWTRWKIWKAKYDKIQTKVKSYNDLIDETDRIKIKNVIDNDKTFLKKKFGDNYKEDLLSDLEFIRKSLNNGKLSYYYVVLSHNLINHAKYLKIDKDLSVFSSKIDDNIKDYFNKD